MAARHGLGLARSWALTAVPMVRPALVGHPLKLKVRAACSTRSFASVSVLELLASSQNRAPARRHIVNGQRSPVITALRIRHNSTQSDPTKRRDEAEQQTPPPPKPVDPLTAPPVSVAETPKPPAKTSADTASILKLLSLAKPQWPLLTIGISCLVVSTGVNLGIPWAIGRIIDFFAPNSESTLLFGLPLEQATWALIAVLFVGALANSGRAMALRLAGQRTVAGIRYVPVRKGVSLKIHVLMNVGIRRTQNSCRYRRRTLSRAELETLCPG